MDMMTKLPEMSDDALVNLRTNAKRLQQSEIPVSDPTLPFCSGCRGRDRRQTACEGESDAKRTAKGAHQRRAAGQAGKARSLERERLADILAAEQPVSAGLDRGSFRAFCGMIGSRLHQGMRYVGLI